MVFQALRHPGPHDVALWKAVQQQQHRPVAVRPAGHAGMNARALHLKVACLKVVKPVHGVAPKVWIIGKSKVPKVKARHNSEQAHR